MRLLPRSATNRRPFESRLPKSFIELSSARRCANIRPMKSDVILSVIMPAYNERETVGTVIRRILTEIPLNLELIIVDDGSTDGTGAILDAIAAQDPRIQVVHKPNGGKTSALIRGFELSRGQIVIIQDADLEYDPAEIIHVVQPILQNNADVVYGSRFMVRRAARVLYFYHYVANRVLTMLSNLL